jgi:hypothetical protein
MFEVECAFVFHGPHLSTLFYLFLCALFIVVLTLLNSLKIELWPLALHSDWPINNNRLIQSPLAVESIALYSQQQRVMRTHAHTHTHTRYLQPSWSRSLTRCTSTMNLIFSFYFYSSLLSIEHQVLHQITISLRLIFCLQFKTNKNIENDTSLCWLASISKNKGKESTRLASSADNHSNLAFSFFWQPTYVQLNNQFMVRTMSSYKAP